jgi:heme exporter protein B
MWRDAWLVAGKDLRIELRSRVLLHQVLPFAALVLFLFAFALGPDHRVLSGAAPGLFWVAVLFLTVLAVQRSAAIEAGPGARDTLRLSGLEPPGVFLGKTLAVVLELAVVEVLLGLGVDLLYGTGIREPGLLVGASLAGTVGLAAAGTLYGSLTQSVRGRETLLPFLLLPVAVPVLLAGSHLWQAALRGQDVSSALSGAPVVGNGPWLALLTAFSLAYLALGVVVFGPIQEAP